MRKESTQVAPNRADAVDQQLVRAVIDYALNGVVLADGGGICRESNALLTAMTGRPRESIIHHPVSDLVHQPDRPRFERWWRSLDEHGPLRSETRLAGPDGAPIPVEVKGVSGAVLGRTLLIVRDLSEEERSRILLEESEARYRGIFESAVEGILQTTFEGGIVAANPSAARILGFESPDELIEAVSDMSTVYADPQEREALVAELRSRGSVSGFETQWRRKDGPGVWVSFSARGLRDDEGELVGLEGFIMDITDRKRAEDELRRSERHFRALIENISDSIVLVAADGTIEYVSPSGLRTFGYSGGESVGSSAFRWLHVDDQEEGIRLFAQVAGKPGSVRSGVFRVAGGDARMRWVEAIAANFLEDPQIRAIVVTARDITERKEAERAIVERERRLQLLLQQMPATMWTTDTDLRVTFFAGDGVLSTDPDFAPSGKRVAEMAANDGEVELAESNHRVALGGGVATYEIEWRGRWWRTHLEPLREDGEIVGTVGVSFDVTDSKLAQEQVERSVRILRDMFEERRHLLERLVTVQEQERTRVSRELHDELGQILTSASLFAQALAERAPDDLAGPLASLCDLLSRATASTRKLVWSLHPIDLEAHGLVPALQRLGSDLERDHDLRVTVRVEGEVSSLSTDVQPAVYRIAQEALTNTVRHGRASAVSIALARHRTGFSMIVEDDGRGFEPRAVMDDPDPTVRMGLVGMHERAAAVGATLTVRAAPGEGTKVRMDIPEPS